MKKDRMRWIIAGGFLLVCLCGVPTLKASPDSGQTPGQTASADPDQPSAAGGEKVKGPIDSSKVIPKGPQWLGAPIMPGGTILKQERTRLTYGYDLSYDLVLAWYQEALKRYPDARYRDWKEEMYIEDQGGSRWQAIIISKTGGPRTTVTIVKDNWTWIIATLFIRFAGVFVVLLFLWIGLNISGMIIRRFIKEEEKKK